MTVAHLVACQNADYQSALCLGAWAPTYVYVCMCARATDIASLPGPVAALAATASELCAGTRARVCNVRCTSMRPRIIQAAENPIVVWWREATSRFAGGGGGRRPSIWLIKRPTAARATAQAEQAEAAAARIVHRVFRRVCLAVAHTHTHGWLCVRGCRAATPAPQKFCTVHGILRIYL